MNLENLCKKFHSMKEYFIEGYFKYDTTNNYLRFSEAINNQLLNCELIEYENTYLYPVNKRCFFSMGDDKILGHNFAFPFIINYELLEKSNLTDSEKEYIKEYSENKFKGYELCENRFALAGRNYTHFIPNYEYFLNNSLLDFSAYVKKSNDKYNNEFTNSIVTIAESIIILVNRVVSHLKKYEKTDKLLRLIDSYEHFIFDKTRNIYDALVRINFIFNLDNCDNIGKLDTYLKGYEIEENTVDIINELYKSMEKVNAWNVTINENDEHSLACIKANKKVSKPNLSFVVKKDTSEYLFDEALDNLITNGSFAFYSNESYNNEIRKLGFDEIDNFGFGGCSEFMINGKTNCGSIDAGINLVQTLNDCIKENENINTYNELINIYKNKIKNYIKLIVDEVNETSKRRALSTPQLIRSLLCDGCVESGIEFNNGGAKYNFSIINICALANAADSLYALKVLVYDNKEYSYSYSREILLNNVNNDNDNGYLERIKSLAFFGNDNDDCDLIAKDIFLYTVNEIRNKKLERGNNAYFFPSCILFDNVSMIGRMTSASLDGRFDYTDIADSGGSMMGCDKVSPTALLNSILKIEPNNALGTWIVNMMISPRTIQDKKQKEAFKILLRNYFENGGLQIQVNCIDKEKLIKALNDETLANSIIVRVGGFCARFSNLSEDVKMNIINRTEY